MHRNGVNYTIFIMLKPRIRVFTISKKALLNGVNSQHEIINKWFYDESIEDSKATTETNTQINYFYDLRC